MAAREAAATAETLDELRATLAAFEGCNLRHTATNLVFADGNPAARVMFVGEAPGMEEDLQGLPFVGRSGQLLDLMLKAIGLDRSFAYIANVIPWRPPGNRDSDAAGDGDLPAVHRAADRAGRPGVPGLLGKASAQQLLKTKASRGCAATGVPIPPAAARSAPCRPSIPPTFSASRCRSVSPGAICWR